MYFVVSKNTVDFCLKSLYKTHCKITLIISGYIIVYRLNSHASHQPYIILYFCVCVNIVYSSVQASNVFVDKLLNFYYHSIAKNTCSFIYMCTVFHSSTSLNIIIIFEKIPVIEKYKF